VVLLFSFVVEEGSRVVVEDVDAVLVGVIAEASDKREKRPKSWLFVFEEKFQESKV